MIYICKVSGCRSNSIRNDNLRFFVLPEDKKFIKLWLKIICPTDQLHSGNNSLCLRWRKKFRVCSLHFLPNSIRRGKLVEDSIPTINLPNIHEEAENKNEVICNVCSSILGDTCYKCIVCEDYILCRRCERFEVHLENHYLIRFSDSLRSMETKAFVQNLKLLSSTNSFDHNSQIKTTDCDSDDEPITKYQKNTNVTLEISDNEKNKITTEVNRVLKIVNKKRKSDNSKSSKFVTKKVKRNTRNVKEISTQTPMESESSESAHEVEFADVNDFKNEKPGEDAINEDTQITFLKTEMDSMLYTMLT